MFSQSLSESLRIKVLLGYPSLLSAVTHNLDEPKPRNQKRLLRQSEIAFALWQTIKKIRFFGVSPSDHLWIHSLIWFCFILAVNSPSLNILLNFFWFSLLWGLPNWQRLHMQSVSISRVGSLGRDPKSIHFFRLVDWISQYHH